MIGETYYTDDEIHKFGFKKIGNNVKISRCTNIYNPNLISIGNNVRIDDFCILSGTINLGSFVHISSYCGLYGAASITMEDFSGLSARVLVYSVSDDYSGKYMTNPTVDEEFTHSIRSPVLIRRHSIIGAGSIILPGVTINEGCAIGAASLVNQNTNPWGVYAGIPAKLRKERDKNLLILEQKLWEKIHNNIIATTE